MRMENWGTLHDLALVYLSLAMGTDSELDRAEIMAISDRMLAWEPESNPEVVQKTIDDVLGLYLELEMENEQLMMTAVMNLKRSKSEAQRLLILGDLVEIAAADGTFLREEGGFIEMLMRTWEVDAEKISPAAIRQTEEELGQQTVWSPVHDLAVIFLALSRSSSEQDSTEKLIRKLLDWLPGADQDLAQRIAVEASTVFHEDTTGSALSSAIDAVKKALPEQQRQALFEELILLVSQEAAPRPGKHPVLEELATRWGVKM